MWRDMRIATVCHSRIGAQEANIQNPLQLPPPLVQLAFPHGKGAWLIQLVWGAREWKFGRTI